MRRALGCKPLALGMRWAVAQVDQNRRLADRGSLPFYYLNLCCLSRGVCDYAVRRMWIVRLALRRPYTFVVASLVLLLLTPFVLLRTPTDIFPSINIPVVSIVWQYAGLDTQEIEQRMNYIQE